jgi:hypothetical protein
MGGIPLINIIAIIHLFFIAALLGTVMTENLMELNVFSRRQRGISVLGTYARLLRLLSRRDEFESKLCEDGVKDLHHANIRNHYWIDLLVELPLAIGAIISGIVMAVLVDNLSILHIVKITLASCVMIGLFFCIKSVLRRNRLLQNDSSTGEVSKETWRLCLTATLWEPLLIPLVFLGFWLGYHRILESIY